MQEISISEFKAKCFALIDEVSKTKKPLRITRYGKAVAEVVPPAPARRAATSWDPEPILSISSTTTLLAPS